MAHRLWQSHQLDPRDFSAMPMDMKLFFVASERLEHEAPDVHKAFYVASKLFGKKK
jgi:hypothetical protein